MLSNTFASHTNLCYSYCHPHLKEKQTETAERLRNLPKTTELIEGEPEFKLRSWTPSRSGDHTEAVNAPLQGTARALQPHLSMAELEGGNVLHGAERGQAASKNSSQSRLAECADPSLYVSSADCETKDQNSCQPPPSLFPRRR